MTIFYINVEQPGLLALCQLSNESPHFLWCCHIVRKPQLSYLMISLQHCKCVLIHCLCNTSIKNKIIGIRGYAGFGLCSDRLSLMANVALISQSVIKTKVQSLQYNFCISGLVFDLDHLNTALNVLYGMDPFTFYCFQFVIFHFFISTSSKWSFCGHDSTHTFTYLLAPDSSKAVIAFLSMTELDTNTYKT